MEAAILREIWRNSRPWLARRVSVATIGALQER
jgi:hypothetical protein